MKEKLAETDPNAFAYPAVIDIGPKVIIKYGLTKREYFAALAMQGMLANSYSNGMQQALSEASRYDIAQMAVEQAEALVTALNKEIK